MTRPTELPTYISLPDASHLVGLPVRALQERIRAGTIRAITIDGKVVVNKTDAKRSVPKEELPDYISLREAAHLTGLPVRALEERIRAGTIRAINIRGEIAVRKQDAKRVADSARVNEQLKSISRGQFKHLRGQPITIAEASKEYDVPSTTIREWIKYEYVGIVADKHPLELDHADMAYCVAVYKVRRAFGILRVPLLDEDGQPYQLKRPDVAEYRRRKRETLVVA